MSAISLSSLKVMPIRATALAQELFIRDNLSLQARNYVLHPFLYGPSRQVSNKFGNAMVKHCSQKAGQVLLESRRGELAAAIHLDISKDVVAYSVQPPQLDLQITNADGRVTGRVPYTPDFVVLHNDGIEIREQRDLTFLVERMRKNPFQYYLDEDGEWHFRAAEIFFKQLGLPYHIYTNQSLPAVLINNAVFLEDYLLENCPELDEVKGRALKQQVEGARCLSMRELLDLRGFDADTIFKAISIGWVYVDLERQRLDITHDLKIYSDEATAKAHRLVEMANMATPLPIPGTLWIRSNSRLCYGGKYYTVILSGERDVSVRNDDGELSCLPLKALQQLHEANQLTGDGIRTEQDAKSLASVSPAELDRALLRLEAVRTGKSDKYSARSISKFSSTTATLSHVDALLALVDEQKKKGNRNAKLPVIVEELAVQAIQEVFNTPEKRSFKAAFAAHHALCEELARSKQVQILPMSYVTFIKRCKEYESVKARQGKRAAYQKAPIVQSLDNLYPIHGVRPHEVLYIDHTIAVIATVGLDGADLGKPTLTVAVDGNVRTARAMILTYDPPSATLVLLILRDYVRRHGRLPKTISVDNGADFRSKEVARFCLIFGIELRFRSPGEPRGGAMIERLLGATEQEIFSSMVGNTRQLKDPRLVTKTVNPFNNAIWTLTATYHALDNYLFDERPNRLHPALGMTPNEFEKKRLEETGQRSHRFVRFDESIMLLTAPHAKKPFHKLCDRRGIWVNHQWYRHPSMDLLKKGTSIEVRVESWLYSVVYVMVKGEWHAAVGGNSRHFDGKGRREVEIAFREQERISGAKAHRQSLTKEGLSFRGKLLDPRHYDPRIGKQQTEMRYLYDQLDMTFAMRVPVELVHYSPASSITFTPSSLISNQMGISEETDFQPDKSTYALTTMTVIQTESQVAPTVIQHEPTPLSKGFFDGIEGYN